MTKDIGAPFRLPMFCIVMLLLGLILRAIGLPYWLIGALAAIFGPGTYLGLRELGPLPRPFHRHEWRDTIINRFMDSLEQRCRCGAARHITEWQDIDMSGGYPGVKRWRAGPHPEASTVAQPSNTGDASGSPSSYRAQPSDPDLNPVSVKDLSASASPATKEQQ